jgi:hypothetical protein
MFPFVLFVPFVANLLRSLQPPALANGRAPADR